MLLGDKIKFLRQQNQMSQETLAWNLSIDCDMLQQWEDNITIPPVVYIYRMQVIFNVSLEEYFKDRTNTYVENPIEEYTFSYDEVDIKSVFKLKYMYLFPITLIIAILLISLNIEYIFSGEFIERYNILYTDILILIVYIIVFININNKYKSVKLDILGKTYNYKLFNNKLEVTVLTNNIILNEYIFYYTDILKQWNDQKYFAFNNDDKLFIIKKQEIMINSYIYSFMNNASAYQAEIHKDNKSELSVILCVLSVLSIFISTLMFGFFIQNNDYDSAHTLLVFYYFAHIPIISIIYGIIRNIKGKRNIINIVIGVLSFLTIIGFGSLSFFQLLIMNIIYK